jgi:hypothetical protein
MNLKQLNQANEKFWQIQSHWALQRISDETIYQQATEIMRSESARRVPIKLRTSIEKALADATMPRKLSHTEFSRRGGRTPKPDTLQLLIEEIVSPNLGMKQQPLFHALKKEIGNGVIVSIDGRSEGLAGVKEIHFIDHDGKLKTAPLSGLKDRLRRAKAKIKSR